MPSFANTPEPPYYAVIFSSQRTEGNHGYSEMATRMVELAGQQVGFLGAESTRDSSGFGITVSYWASESAIKAWKANIEHLAAQEQGRSSWYAHFKVRVSKVERAYMQWVNSRSCKPQRLPDTLASWSPPHRTTVSNPHINLVCGVAQGGFSCHQPNCKFNVDANSGHAFGILLAAVGTLRPCGAPAPVN